MAESEDNRASTDAPLRILDRKRLNNGKLGSAQPHRSSKLQLKCPECSSSRIVKAGTRDTTEGPIQRFYCKDCGFRFSDPNRNLNPGPQKPLQKISKQSLKRPVDIPSPRQVCELLTEESKNLTKTQGTRQKRAAGATKPDYETTKGLIIRFMAWLEKEGYKSTGYLERIQRLAKLGAVLTDPEDIKKVIAEQPWKDSVKLYTTCAYDAMTKMLGITWTPPKYTPEESLPFIPEESELDQLIASCKSRRMATYLQTLKETFADPGEILRMEWKDINFKNRVISINHPVKRHRPRQLEVSSKLLAMLNALPKKSKRVFPTTYHNMFACFRTIRKRAAQNLQNPRLTEISFKTFRHWGGTMIAYYTHGNVLKVQELLGHKNIQNTMKYIHMIHFKDDEFEIATATTQEEIKELGAAGFEKYDQHQGMHFYRKPKKFTHYS